MPIEKLPEPRTAAAEEYGWGSDPVTMRDVRLKLNEVIEAVNGINCYLNAGLVSVTSSPLPVPGSVQQEREEALAGAIALFERAAKAVAIGEERNYQADIMQTPCGLLDKARLRVISAAQREYSQNKREFSASEAAKAYARTREPSQNRDTKVERE